MCAALLLLPLAPAAALAQEPPPTIGPFAADVRGSLARYGQNLDVAARRSLPATALPSRGLGIDLTATWYAVRWRAVTFGVGGHLLVSRGVENPPAPAGSPPGAASTPPVTTRLSSWAPQLSFNFGTGRGWSYLSGGIGRATFTAVPDGSPDPEPLRTKTIDYGGGARWFTKRHLAFTFDVRFYAMNPTDATPANPGHPRMTLLVVSAGISVK